MATSAQLIFHHLDGRNPAIGTDLAKKCRALMIKAHPTVLYGAAGVAADQRAYFTRCVTRQGNMPEAQPEDTAGRPAPSTTGQGVPQ